MKILMTGGTGMVGHAVGAEWAKLGHEITVVSRNAQRAKRDCPFARGSVEWNGLSTAGFDAVIHLAGENLAAKRWSESQKRKIRASRVDTAHQLANAMRVSPPALYLSASAIGIYGDRGDEWLDEGSQLGNGFLAELCRDWELETPAKRNCYARFGMILSRKGGAFPPIARATYFSGGTILGTGRQWQSWVHIDDVVSGLTRLLTDPNLSGTFNFASPEPVTQAEFARTLARVMGRPTLLKIPAFALKLGLGELSSILLSSAKVRPERLSKAGFSFRHPRLDEALSELI